MEEGVQIMIMTRMILADPDFPCKVLPLGEFGAEAAGLDLARVTDECAHYHRAALTKFQLWCFATRALHLLIRFASRATLAIWSPE